MRDLPSRPKLPGLILLLPALLSLLPAHSNVQAFQAVTIAPSMDVSQLDGTTGFRVVGDADGDQAGGALAVGDVNGDGMGDLIVGAWNADEAYVVFGGLEMDATVLLGSLDGTNGFRMKANLSFINFASIAAIGSAVASADVNGDGIGCVQSFPHPSISHRFLHCTKDVSASISPFSVALTFSHAQAHAL